MQIYGVLLALVGALVLSAHAQSVRQGAGFSDTVYTARLDSFQVYPPYKPRPDTTGSAVCNYNRNIANQPVNCLLVHGVTTATTVTIKRGYRDQYGPIVYVVGTISNALNQAYLPQSLEFTFNINGDAELEREFLSGQWYFEIDSAYFPDGEIRGQIEHSLLVYSRLNTTLIGNNGPNRGVLVGDYNLFNPSSVLAIEVDHTVVAPRSGGIGTGVSSGGSGFVTFSPPDSPVRMKNIDFSKANDALYAESVSVEITESQVTTNGGGSISGTVFYSDAIPYITHMARLEAIEVVPPTLSRAKGCALFSYTCGSGILEYLIVHDVETIDNAPVTAAGVYNGVDGSVGLLEFPLSRAKSPIFGSVTLNSAEEQALLGGNYYVQISSAKYPTGSIRGQIVKDWNYWAYLSGTQQVPPVSTPAVGCATFSVLGNQQLEYWVVYGGLSTPAQVVLQKGNIGENANFTKVIAEFISVGYPFSPVIGDEIILDSSAVNDLRSSNTYITVRSGDFYAGEIRGQILKRVKASCDNNVTPAAPDFLPDLLPGDSINNIGEAPNGFTLPYFLLPTPPKNSALKMEYFFGLVACCLAAFLLTFRP